MSAITVVGSVNIDLLIEVERHPKPGETLLGLAGQYIPGGKGANQAVAAAQLDAPVTFIAAVGEDENAELALSHLRRANVNLDLLQRVPGSTGLAVVVVDAGGENSIIVLPGANASLALDVRSLNAISSADLVLVQGEISAALLLEVATAAKARFVINLAPFIAVDPAVLRRADPLIVNEVEAEQLLALLTGGHFGDDSTRAAALIEWGVRSVVVTLGAGGSIVADQSGLVAVSSPRVQVVDTTGAGDAFCGALAARLVRGATLVDAATFASSAAAFSVTSLGAQSSYAWPGDLDA